jgi:hypothetical protein
VSVAETRPPERCTISAVAGPTVPRMARAKVGVGPSVAVLDTAAAPGMACTEAVLPAMRGSLVRRVMATTNCLGPEAATV